MATLSEALAIASQYYQAGQFPPAEQICRQILAADPNHPDAWHLLGVMALQSGQPALAVEYIRRAIQSNAAESIFHANLGSALQAQGNLDEAINSFQRALQLKPDCTEVYNNLGNAFHARGNLNEAIACLRRAVQLKPDLAEAHNNLGAVLQAQGMLAEAVNCFRRALELNTNYVAAHVNLGKAFNDLEKLDDAADCFHRALRLQPDHADVLNNLGVTYQNKDDLDAAVAHYEKALQKQPDYVEAFNNLGLARQEQGQYDEAAALFRRAIKLRPAYAAAHCNRSILNLLRGDFDNGWPEYEWRWKTSALPAREFSRPMWRGEPLAGRRILLYAEQGIGDTIQFIRYAPLIKRMGGLVLVECQKPLLKLFGSCHGIDQVVAAGDPLPEFDMHVPLLSLPGILKTTLSNIPADVPYLFADSTLVDLWQKKLQEIRGFRIGINWHGREGNTESRRRDIPLNLFVKLAQIPGIRLISLQKGAGRADLAPAGDLVFDPGDDLDTVHGAFADTAAIMMNLDLVITSDTSIPHLAGALGVPVWLALPFVPNWRWLLDRADSPWYPSMRLFRQAALGDWSGAFDQIRGELSRLVASSS